MDIKQAKNILNDAMKSIDRYCADNQEISVINKLCDVIKFLLDEIDCIKSPTMTVLHCGTEQKSTELSPILPPSQIDIPMPPVKRNYDARDAQ